MKKWLKIIEDNFSELHIGDEVAPAYPGNINNDTIDEPVEENSKSINEAYVINGVDISNGEHITLTGKNNNSSLNVSRQELLEHWWFKKN